MAEEKQAQGSGSELATAAGAPQFRATRSAAEMAMLESEGYADPGLAEHKGAKHLEEHWHAGREGLRKEDYEEENARLQEQRGYGPRALVSRAAAAVGGMMSAAAAAVAPSYFKTSRSAAELAYGNTVDYAEPGLAEHKGAKHLEEHWHAGKDGLRPEEEEEEQERLRELAEHQASKGIVQRASEAMSATAAAATGKAGDVLQAAKDMVGLSSEKR